MSGGLYGWDARATRPRYSSRDESAPWTCPKANVESNSEWTGRYERPPKGLRGRREWRGRDRGVKGGRMEEGSPVFIPKIGR